MGKKWNGISMNCGIITTGITHVMCNRMPEGGDREKRTEEIFEVTNG